MRRADRRTDDIRLVSPLREFLHTESAGGALIVVATVAALVWANSPWADAYERLWGSEIALTVAGHTLSLDLRHWVNDGAMTVFFLVVGLEIKRELTAGTLASVRAALTPTVAAVGGMVVPAALYLAVAGGTAPRGWAVPMATDIALAIGLLALLGDRVPPAARTFLLALAVVDDIGAIAVIALVYSDGIAFGWLAVGLGAVAVTVALRRLGSQRTGAYVAVGAVLWFALHEAGVHATLAGVAMGLLAPATAHLRAELVDADDLADVSSVEAAHETLRLARGSVSVVEWLQHVLHPWTSYLVVPVFALANAGVVVSADGLRDAVRSPVTWGVVVGLVIGKPLGVVLATTLAGRAGLDVSAVAPRRRLAGLGATAGIGFTVALFVTELAFTDESTRADAKLGVLAASLVAAALAWALLRRGGAQAEGVGLGVSP